MRGAGGGGGRRRQGTEGPPRARAAPGARSAAPRSAAAPRGRQPRRAEASASPEPRRGFRPRQPELRVRAGAPGRGGEASPGPPSPGPPRPSGTASPERKPRVSPSSPPHFTRSHELRLTGSCFAARRPLRACPGSARAGAAPRAVSGRTAWQGEPRAVVQETRSKGPGTRAAPGDGASGTPTCEGSSPWTHGRIHTHV